MKHFGHHNAVRSLKMISTNATATNTFDTITSQHGIAFVIGCISISFDGTSIPFANIAVSSKIKLKSVVSAFRWQ